MIDLSANENPYEHFGKSLAGMNRYLEYKELDRLVSKLSDYCGTDKKRIVVSNGTNSLIQMVMLKFFKSRDLFVFNPNGYEAVTLAKDLGMKVRRMQLRPPRFKIDWKSLDIRNSFIIIDYPNNPTGEFLISSEELIFLLEKNNLVIVDEAAYEYSKKTFIDLVDKYGSLVITRTLDKAFGLAGLRVSYMLMGDDILEGIDRGIHINRSDCFGALEALADKEYVRNSILNNHKEREYIQNGLREKGMEVFNSEANFLLVKTEDQNFALALREKGILIEDLSRFWLNGYYRISVGSRKENKSLIRAIK